MLRPDIGRSETLLCFFRRTCSDITLPAVCRECLTRAMLGCDLPAFGLLPAGEPRQLYGIRSTLRPVRQLVGSISRSTAFDILHEQLRYCDLIISVSTFKMSLKVVFPWPNLVLLLARGSSTSIIELRSLDSQHTVTGLLVSSQIMRRSEAIVVVASRYITLERTSVCQHVLSVSS
jgi:hypothetical protein